LTSLAVYRIGGGRVYEVQGWADVHRLFHREGWAKSRIAHKLGMSRNTVTRLLELDEPPRYVRGSAGSKLDPHRGSIARMLDEDDSVPATVVLEHLRRQGFEGGITILRDYLAEIRPLFRQAKSYQRTGYLPGEAGPY
jgi:transposase